ncbi:MAG TPA: metallopeptidase family protein [Alphaproteobacteria bacterium]
MNPPPPRRPVEPPSAADLEDLAREAFATIPQRLARHVRDVIIRIEEFPDDATLDEMGLESPFDLLGLYRGVSLDRKSVADVSTDVDMIFLYRRPLLDYWVETGEPLYDVVRHVLIHEIGHHFGLSDAEMALIEDDAWARGGGAGSEPDDT